MNCREELKVSPLPEENAETDMNGDLVVHCCANIEATHESNAARFLEECKKDVQHETIARTLSLWLLGAPIHVQDVLVMRLCIRSERGSRHDLGHRVI